MNHCKPSAVPIDPNVKLGLCEEEPPIDKGQF